MLRTVFARLVVVVVVVVVGGGGLTACPERDAAIDYVGGAPGRQVDEARVRAKAAEEKILKKTEAANAVAGQE